MLPQVDFGKVDISLPPPPNLPLISHIKKILPQDGKLSKKKKKHPHGSQKKKIHHQCSEEKKNHPDPNFLPPLEI